MKLFFTVISLYSKCPNNHPAWIFLGVDPNETQIFWVLKKYLFLSFGFESGPKTKT